jgi:putative transposase
MRRFWVSSTGIQPQRAGRVYRLRTLERQSSPLRHGPQHVMYRRPDGKDLFDTERDYQSYLAVLRTMREELALKVRRFCLMPDHVHLLLDPNGCGERLTLLMERLADLGTLRLRSQTLSWEKCVLFRPIESDAHLRTCMRYIDLNPLHAGLVARPQEYLWSSYGALIGLRPCDGLDPDPWYLSLGEHTAERQLRYREFVEHPERDAELFAPDEASSDWE